MLANKMKNTKTKLNKKALFLYPRDTMHTGWGPCDYSNVLRNLNCTSTRGE